MSKRGQGFSLELIVSASVFLAVTVGILASISITDDDSIPVVEQDVNGFVNQFFSTTSSENDIAFIENNVINTEKLARLQSLGYDQLRNRIGARSDFCLVIVDKNGDLKPLNGKYGIGSDNILVASQSSCGGVVIASQNATPLDTGCTFKDGSPVGVLGTRILKERTTYGLGGVTCTEKVVKCLGNNTWDDANYNLYLLRCDEQPSTQSCYDDGTILRAGANPITVSHGQSVEYANSLTFSQEVHECQTITRTCVDGNFTPPLTSQVSYKYPLVNGAYICNALPICTDGFQGPSEDGIDCSNNDNSVCTTLGANGVGSQKQFCPGVASRNICGQEWCHIDGVHVMNKTIIESSLGIGSSVSYTCTDNYKATCPSGTYICGVGEDNVSLYQTVGCANGGCTKQKVTTCTPRTYCDPTRNQVFTITGCVNGQGTCAETAGPTCPFGCALTQSQQGVTISFGCNSG